MLRRTGFKKAEFVRKPVVYAPVPEHLRRKASMGPVELVAIPKTVREENAHYRAMARDKACQLLIPGVCNFDPATVVLAHSNWHDKGAHRKASDFYGVWGCFACHSWLDQGGADGDVKRAMFDLGMKRMECALGELIQDGTTKPRDRAAAVWALDRIRTSYPAPP